MSGLGVLVTTSAAVMSFVMNGVPIEARFMQSDAPACVLAKRQASEWRQQKHAVVEQRLADWCIAGAAIGGRWVSVQWRRHATDRYATGWHVEIPLNGSSRTAPVASAGSVWNFDLRDRSIGTRIRFRQSGAHLASHHADSGRSVGGLAEPAVPNSTSPLRISRSPAGQLLVSGRHPDGGAYSILIERGLQP